MPGKRETVAKQGVAKRLESILAGAFAGPPTPLKDIPTRDGKPRSIGKDQPRKRRRRQRKKAIA